MTATLETLHNPATGDRMTILTSALRSGSGPFVFACDLAPRAKGSPPHRHSRISETFEVTGGTVAIQSGTLIEHVTVGGTRHISPGRLHGFHNPTDRPASFTCTVTPGVEFEKFMRAMYGLAAAGRTNADGMPTDPRLLALVLRQADLIVPRIPVALQSALLSLLATLARIGGADRTLHPYWRV